MSDVEVWKPIDFDDRYEVSNLGRVRSFCIRGKYGTGRRAKNPLILRTPADGTGYQIVSIGDGNTRKVHLLVLHAFVGPRPEGIVGCHNDGNPLNCRLDNLRYGTQAENMADRVMHGTLSEGDRHGQISIKSPMYEELLSLVNSGVPQTEIARRFGTSKSSVQRAIKRARRIDSTLTLRNDGRAA